MTFGNHNTGPTKNVVFPESLCLMSKAQLQHAPFQQLISNWEEKRQHQRANIFFLLLGRRKREVCSFSSCRVWYQSKHYTLSLSCSFCLICCRSIGWVKYCLCCVVCVSLASMCWHVSSGVFPFTCCWKRRKKRFDRVGRDQLRWCHCVRPLLCQHFQTRRRDWLWRNISEQYMYI